MAPSIDRKNVLVTGGAGFIGSHLCEALARTSNVICVDNFSTGTPDNLRALLQQPNFELLRHDINEPIDLEAQRELDRFHVRVQGIQEVYHLACPVSKGAFDHVRLATLQTNSTGLRHVLELAVGYKAKVLFTSTSALYEPTGEPFIGEDGRCWNDHLVEQAAYDESKRFAETMIQTYADIHHLPAKLIRVFRTYGPRMKADDGNILPDLVRAALDHRDLELPFSEDARFSLCYVGDLVDGLMKAMDHGLDFRVMNLGSDQELRLGNVVERVLQLTGSTARIRFRPQGGHAISPVPNIDKARQLLHWLPLRRLDEGLKAMVDHARSEHREANTFGA